MCHVTNLILSVSRIVMGGVKAVRYLGPYFEDKVNPVLDSQQHMTSFHCTI